MKLSEKLSEVNVVTDLARQLRELKNWRHVALNAAVSTGFSFAGNYLPPSITPGLRKEVIRLLDEKIKELTAKLMLVGVDEFD